MADKESYYSYSTEELPRGKEREDPEILLLQERLRQAEDDLSRLSQDAEAYRLGRQAALDEACALLQGRAEAEARRRNRRACSCLLSLRKELLAREECRAQRAWLPLEEAHAANACLARRLGRLLDAAGPFVDFIDLLAGVAAKDSESGQEEDNGWLFADRVAIRVDATMAHDGQRPTLGDFRKLKRAAEAAVAGYDEYVDTEDEDETEKPNAAGDLLLQGLPPAKGGWNGVSSSRDRGPG